MKAIVQQVGARMDYAVPRALYAAGHLERLVTDLHFTKPPRLRRLQHYCSGIPEKLVSSNKSFALTYRTMLSRNPNRAWPHTFIMEEIGPRTCDVMDAAGVDLVYGFDTAMLPGMDRMRKAGAMIVLEQCIAPRAEFIGALETLATKLEDAGVDPTESGLEETRGYFRMMSAIERQEWPRADRIYCPSQFVQDALIKEGVPAAKIRLLPYGVSLKQGPSEHQRQGGKPRVVFGGAFSWRKGAFEFGRLASKLSNEARFEAYGRSLIAEPVRHRIAPAVDFRGHLQKADFHRAISSADVFVLPSYMEGSATVVYEAMAMGLACVVTAQCGSVITHGADGLIVNAGDESALEQAVSRLINDSAFRNQLGERAIETSRRFTRESYGARVVSALQDDLAVWKAGR